MKHIWKIIEKAACFVAMILGALIAIIMLLVFIPINAIRGVSPRETIESLRFAWEMGKDENEES